MVPNTSSNILTNEGHLKNTQSMYLVKSTTSKTKILLSVIFYISIFTNY